uniref:NADH-ubiquinone oxidoreductase chain 2 n=1 Tax=Pipunculus sp. XL-2018 TaxID=2321082 RepID=A0A5H2PFW8_9MUSC|nr:NADH dehydrogenase subunit 2 [Pipunculus sp. XL-2018]
MMNFQKNLFIMIMMTGTMITVSSTSWLSAWMGLEINLLSFIPLMSDSNSLSSTEASLKYFLVQALASCILLMGMIMSFYKISFAYMINMQFNYSSVIIFSSLVMKSGTSPFHWWFPNVMEGLSWINSLILMTWQKIAPILLISYLIIEPLMTICIIFSASIGSIGGLNQTSLRKLMAYSSINHLGWMLLAMKSSESLWIMYFCFYSILSLNIIMIFYLFGLSHMNQIFSQFFYSKNLKFFTFLSLLSLGGLPPFLGFIPKWMVIESLTNIAQISLLVLLMIMTLISLFYYLRLCYSAFMLNFFEINVISFSSSSMSTNLLTTLTFISTTGLFIVSFLYFLL